MLLAIAMGLPSRYAIGQEVYFHPNMFNVTPLNYDKIAIPARIEKVQFSGAKVTYDLAVLCEEHDAQGNVELRYYDAITIKDVDSTFVSTYQDICTEHARTLRIQTDEEIRQNPELASSGYTMNQKLLRLKARREGLTEQQIRELAAVRFYKGLDALRVQYKEDTDGCA